MRKKACARFLPACLYASLSFYNGIAYAEEQMYISGKPTNASAIRDMQSLLDKFGAKYSVKCSVGEVMISIDSLRWSCHKIVSLIEDPQFEELRQRVSRLEEQFVLLDSNLKTIANMNDALTKRLERLENSD